MIIGILLNIFYLIPPKHTMGNPIIIYPHIVLGDGCGIRGGFVTVQLEITDSYIYDEFLIEIKYDPEVVTPHWIWEELICYTQLSDWYYDEGTLYCYFNNWYKYDCISLFNIEFKADTIGYTELEVLFGFVWENYNWPAIPDNGSITVSDTTTQVIHLKEGWNAISAFVEPDTPMMDGMFASLGDNLLYLYGGNCIYYPGWSGWMMPAWDRHCGYYLKVAEETTLYIGGNTPEYCQIDLDEGWNLVPVNTCQPVFITDFFDEYAEFVEAVKESDGTDVFWPDMDVYKLRNLLPGKSYMVKMTDPCTLDIPAFWY